MKKNILFIFLFLIFPISVYADSVELKCNDSDNKQIICEIYGNSNNTITEVDFKVTNSKNIILSSVIIDNEWRTLKNSSKQILITRTTNTNKFKIADITLNNEKDESGYVSVEAVKFKDSNNNTTEVSSVKKNIPLPDNDSLLRLIIIDNYLINFKPDVFEYSLKIKKENSLKITVIPEVEDTKYTIIRNHDLTNDTEIEIITNSTTQTSSTYKIRIIKDVKESNKKYLYIFIGTVSFIVIINIIRIIDSRKNR